MSEKDFTVNYTTINHTARKELGLTCNEYCVLDIIYHLSSNPKNKSGWCSINQIKIADLIGFTREGVNKIEAKLEIQGFLEKKGHLRKVTDKWYDKAIIKSEQSSQFEPTKKRTKFTKKVNKVHLKSEQSSLHTFNNNNTSNIYIVQEKDFLRAWNLYPNPMGKKVAWEHFQQSINSEQDLKDFFTAMSNYKKFIYSAKIQRQFIKLGKTFFNPDTWREYITMPGDGSTDSELSETGERLKTEIMKLKNAQECEAYNNLLSKSRIKSKNY
jgi:hypothetical protein